MSTPRARGFTLIEILVVITIIAALLALAVPYLQNAQDKSNATICRSNLGAIGKTLSIWKTDRNRGNWPKESGIKFLLLLVRDGMIEEKDMKVFLCPGTDDLNTAESDPVKGSAYKDWDALDSSTISYAGRDAKEFPINKNREGAEVIAADDNEGRANHRYATNYLYADGSTDYFDIDTDAREIGLDFKEQGFVPVGPESPVERFQKLRVD